MTSRSIKIAQENQQRQRQVFFDKQYRGQIRCMVPWQTLGISPNGDAFMCLSPSWIPKYIGNILNCNSIYDVLNSEMAQSIRQEVFKGSYLYCNHKICSFFAKVDPALYRIDGPPSEPTELQSSDLLMSRQIPRNLIFDFDYTCNFRCPSCRTQVINTNKHPITRPINNRIVQRIKSLIIDEIKDQPVDIRWAGGEPFISEPYVDLLDYIGSKNKPNIQNTIQTNGSYLKSKKELVQRLLPGIHELRVSFDAATESTYQQVRVNGVWSTLLDNVRWVRELINRQHPETKLTADFVVQRTNYQEIPAFVTLCKELGIDKIHWQKMWNWGSWPQEEFDQHNVYIPTHPEYPQLVQAFADAGQPMSLI